MNLLKLFHRMIGVILTVLLLAGFDISCTTQTLFVRGPTVLLSTLALSSRTAHAQTAPLIPPEPQINLADTGERIWKQANFQYEFERWQPADKAWHAWGTFVSQPRSWSVFSTVSGGEFQLGVIRIGERYWYGLEGITWQPFTETDVTSSEPDQSVVLAWALLTSADLELHALFPNQTARLKDSAASIEEIPCYEYTWQRSGDGTEGALFLNATNLLPVQVEYRNGDELSLRARFHHINDPSSIIRSPEPKADLSLDDARMALNTLEVFRWVSHWTILPDQPGIEKASMDFTNDGIYSLPYHAQWVWAHFERAKDSYSLTFFLFWSESEVDKWASVTGHSSWAEWNTDLDQMFSAFNAFRADINVTGSLISPNWIEVEGFTCREYLFEQPAVASEEGAGLAHELRLCATDEGVPVRAQLRTLAVNVQTGAQVIMSEGEWILARVNDPRDAQTVLEAIRSLPDAARDSFPQMMAPTPGVATETPSTPAVEEEAP